MNLFQSSRPTAVAAGIAFVLLHGSVSEALQEAQPPAQDEDTSEDDNEKTEAGALSEYVFVEGSLPYVPNSNTVATKLPLELRLTPNNVGIVTSPLIRERFDRVVGDTLVNVSNVNVQTQNGVTDFFYIRGFDSLSSSLVLTDGAPEPEATLYQLYNVDRVEVLKGPGGFLYGSNPLAGTVNLVRKQPLPANFFNFRGGGGSFETYEGAFDLNLGDASRSTSFRLNGLVRDQGSYRPGKGGRTVAVNPSVTWQPSDTTRINANFEYLDLSFVPDSGLPVLRDTVVDVDRGTNYQWSGDQSDQEALRFQVDMETKLNDVVSIRNKFYRRDLDWISAGTIFNGAFPTSATTFALSRSVLSLDDAQDFTGNQFEAVIDFETGALRHNLLSGLELARQADVFSLDVGVLPLVDLFDPVDAPGTTPTPLPPFSFAGDSRSIILSPYVIDQITFNDKLHVLLGGRWDRIDFNDTVTERSTVDSQFSPRVGVLVAPRTDLSIYGNFSRAFAPPSPRVIEELASESSTQYEGGVKKRFAPWNTEATFAVYYLERENIPIPDDSGFTQQIGNQRSTGFEVDLAAQPTPDTRALLSYAYNDAELTSFAESIVVSIAPPASIVVDRSGNKPAFAPGHLLNFWLSHDLSRSFGVAFGGRYVGSQFIAEDNLFAIDGVLTFDATAFYRFQDVTLRANFKNLTDREYFQRGFGGTSVIPAAPFSAFFSVDIQM